MATRSFLAEHRDDPGDNANKSSKDVETHDCEKHGDVNGISIPATIVTSEAVMLLKSWAFGACRRITARWPR